MSTVSSARPPIPEIPTELESNSLPNGKEPANKKTDPRASPDPHSVLYSEVISTVSTQLPDQSNEQNGVFTMDEEERALDRLSPDRNKGIT